MNELISCGQIQTDKLVLANQPDIVVEDKQRKTAAVTDVATISRSTILTHIHNITWKGKSGCGEGNKVWKGLTRYS